MAPFKWSLIVLLCGILLLGLPLRANSETPEVEKKSATECRKHIEKALEQYWDQGEPGENKEGLTADTTNHSNDDDDEDEDEEDPPVTNASKGHHEPDQDDEDEDDDEDDEEEEDTTTEAHQEVDENNDEDEEEGNQADDDEDEDEEEEGEEEEEADNEDDEGNQESNGDEEDADDEATDEADDDDDDDEDEDEAELESGSDVSAQMKTPQSEEKEASVDATQDDDEEEEEEEEEEGDDDEEEETHEEKKEETTSDKVTGGTDSASVGVAQELPQAAGHPGQPSTPKTEKEAPQAVVEPTRVSEPAETDTGDDEDEDEEDTEQESEDDDDAIENIYEEEEDDEDEASSGVTFRSRDHIDVILDLDEIGTEYDKEEEKLAQSIFREIKRIEGVSIKPIEMLYKYADSTTRVLGDAEIFNKPMMLFLGPWSSGKTTILNYILGLERTPAALKTGTGITDVDFTLITYGDQRQVVSGTELAADWRYAGVQKFGQGFLDHFRSISLPNTLLKKVILVDTPGILESRKNSERGYSFNDAFQWFIDRADAIYVVLDPTKVDIGGELGSVLDQLKGREVRFILNKADTIRRSDLMRVVGQLFWNLSPLMSSTEAPVIYAVSLTTKPYHPSAPAKFLADQEKNFLYDLQDTLDKRVENRILYARRHAVRVRNHAKMVDCYLSTYYRHKSIFSNKKNVAKQIVENPREYNIFEGVGSFSNVSRYDLPDPVTYKDFFKLHPLYDFRPLASTCSYFRGCPMDKLDTAIATEIPELFAKYKKAKNSAAPPKQEGR